MDGLQLQQALRASALQIPIIFITGHGDIPLSVKAIKAGAIDFFPKPIDDQKLLRAVDEALQRDALVRAERAARDAVSNRYATLTPREREVMTLVVRGMLNKQIASALGASEKTIKIHRSRVMEKMKVNSVADLVRAVETIGLGPDTALSPS
jgi:FixJ family two-component response regulator